MQDIEILAICKTYTNQTVIGMGALKGAPCTIQGVVDNGDGTQTMTLKWTDTNGDPHTTDVVLPTAIFDITNPTNGQTIRYNATSGKWENSNVSFSADLGDLDDVVISSAQDGQVLTYDAANNRWINADGSTVADLEDLTDVTITTVQNGQLLSYNSTSQKWVNVTLDIDDLGNVSITSATDGQVLTYDATAGKWQNKDLPTIDAALSTTSENAVQNKVIALKFEQLSASEIDYDGTTSGLTADDVQEAIDELADEKVDKVTGKGLSTNDFTDALKDKLDDIEAEADVNVIEEVQINGTALVPDANKAVNIEMGIDDLTDVDLTGITNGQVLAYDSTNQKMVPADKGGTYTAGDGIEIDAQNNIKVVKRLIVTDTMPTAGADYVGEGKQRLYVGANTQDYKKGGIYDCIATEEGGVTTYSWTLISTAEVDLTKYKKIFEGTSAAWEALSLAEKTSYDLAMITDDADNGDISQAVESGNLHPVSSDAVYDSEQEIYAVMGQMGAKNLLPNIVSSGSYASSGTVTKNANGSLTINGTFDAVTTINIDYLNGLLNAVFDVTDLVGTDIAVKLLDTEVSGITLQVGYFNSAGTRISLEGVSTKANITFPTGAIKSATYLRIASGTYDNVTVYPMMQLASDTDSTYQPYAKTNQQLTKDKAEQTEVNDMVNVLAAKNLLLFDIENIKASNPNGTWNGNSYTYLGITYTLVLNSDGSLAYVEANGTANANAQAQFHFMSVSLGKKVYMPEGHILMSGCPSGGSDATFSQVLYYDGSWYVDIGKSGGKDINITDSTKAIDFYINIKNGTTADHQKFYPMLRLASITDDTYEPYAKTNQQLTAENEALTNQANDMVNVLGAKNLLPIDATSQTFKGITWTVNNDGSITANGTAEGSSFIRFAPHGTDFSKILPSNIPLTLSCECSDNTLKPSSYSTYFALFSASGSGTEKIMDTVESDGHGFTKEFTVQDLTFVNTYIQIADGVTVNNVTFKPMIRPASIDDDTYAPYAMSNAKLTEKVEEIDAQLITWESKNYTWTPQGVNTTQQLSASGFGFSSMSDIVSVIVDSGSTNAAAAYCTPLNGGTISFYLRQHANISTAEMTGRVVVGYKKSN